MPIVRLPGGSLRDEIRETVYDTVDITPTSVILGTDRFFSDVQGKGKSLTNLRQNNLLETAVSYRIQGLALDAQNFSVANVTVIPTLLQHSALALTVGEKKYWEGPARFASGRMYSDLGGLDTSIFQSHGFPAVASVVLQGKHVIDINPLQTFFVEWIREGMSASEVTASTPAANTKVRYVCSLKGLKRRPVQ